MGPRWILLLTALAACSRNNPWFFPPEDTADETADTGDTRETEDGGDGGSTTEPDPLTTSQTGGGAAETTDAGAPMTSSSSEPDTSTGPAPTTGDTTDTTTDAGMQCTDVCGTPGCGRCPEMDMVGLPGFTIAAREASNAQYQQFLAADVDPATQPATCAWNTDFAPTTWPLAPEAASLPVVNIDWCDAQAFCHWSGARLCGAIDGGSSPLTAIVNPLLDQWYRACSGGIGTIYPYGTLYEPGTCNDKAAGLGEPAPVGSFSECVGPLPGLFDLSGNVWEWVDSCSGDQGSDDECLRRGGSFFSVATDLRCDLLSKRSRATALDHVGVRCCSL